MGYKKDYKKEMEDITDRLETGIKELFESEKYKNYLRTMAKFHNYSVNNTVLIHMQMPNSQMVASYKAWKEKFNRQVKKGEKAIRIFAPIEVKSNMNIEADKIDPVTKLPVLDESGEPVTEIKNVKELRFKLVPVFDVSQTEGEPLPSIAENLIGNVENYETFINALKYVSPFPITFEELPESTDGRCIFGNENRIEIRKGMSEIQTVSAAIHEMAHSILHKKENEKLEKPDNKSLKTKEIEAESVSYVVCQHFGIETSANSFGYISSWSSGKKLKELKDSLETIRNTSANIINSVEEYLAGIQKNRENQKKLEKEQEVTLDSTSEPTVTIIWSENEYFYEGETMSFFQANKLMKKLDEENIEKPGYDKTRFRIDFMINGEFHEYEGRQDLGDGKGTLIEHIEKFYVYCEDNVEWDNRILLNEGEEALKAEKAYRSFMLNEVIPYLKLHCRLSETEQTSKTALQKNKNMTSAEINYHTAIQEYVSKCREKINQGDYSLPPIPQLEDFDTTFQTYNEQIKEEITQEAANAGTTVEEYAANGYEPYIMPDKDITIEERNEFGYDYEGMLPLTQKRALELFDSDNVIYTLYHDNTEGMVFERDEILNAKDVIFGIEKEDWEMSEEYKQLKSHFENEIPSENKDKYSIYQLKDGEELHYHRFVSFEELKKHDLKVDVNNYEFVYSDDLKENDTLDTIYNKFNTAHHDDFRGHSLSVSDVIVIEKENEISSYYVDRIGFKELPVFLGNETFPSKKEIEIISACNSNYKGMVAFIDSDDYVYLGKSENYHYGKVCYYDNSDKSMMFISDDKKIYYFLYGDGWVISQQEMLDRGYCTKEIYEEFDRLQKTVLKDLPYKDGFDGIKFGKEPFVLSDKLNTKSSDISEQAKQSLEPTPIQNNNNLIGKTVTINGRQFIIKSVNKISNTVSMIDLTFQQKVGFAISREEPIEYINKFLEQKIEKSTPQKDKNQKIKKTSVIKALKENKEEISGKIKENKEMKRQDRRIL